MTLTVSRSCLPQRDGRSLTANGFLAALAMSNALLEVGLQYCHDLFKITTALSRIGCV